MRISFRSYFIFVFIFLGIGLIFLPNLIIGFGESRFVKYGVFYISLVSLFLIYLFSNRVDLDRHKNSQALVLIFSLPLLVDILTYRLFTEINDSIRGFGIIVSWICIAFLFVEFSRSSMGKGANPRAHLKKIISPYFYLCLLILICQFLSLFLIFLGLDLLSYELIPRYGYEFYGRLERENEGILGLPEFVAPGWIALIGISERVYTFSDIPITLLGWSYEPHIAAYFLTPSIFFVHLFFKSNSARYLVYFLFLIFLLGAGSLTNYITSSLVLLIWLILSKRLFSLNYLIFFFFLFLFLIFYISFSDTSFLYDVLKPTLNLIDKKIINPTGISMQVSQFYWENLLRAKEFYGTGILYVPDITESEEIDVGLITIITLFIFYTCSFLLCLRGLFYKDERFFCSLALLYVIIHSFKFPLMAFIYPYWFFIHLILLESFYIFSVSKPKDYYQSDKP